MSSNKKLAEQILKNVGGKEYIKFSALRYKASV